MQSWVEPDSQSRGQARKQAKDTIESCKTFEAKKGSKELADTIRLTLVEFQAFEGFWHRRSDAESATEFARLHAEQKGKEDV
eukprot:7678665-Pyramimonas_sp.AAC.1